MLSAIHASFHNHLESSRVAKVNKVSARLSKLSKVIQLVRDLGEYYQRLYTPCSPLTILDTEILDKM